jgi:hypothetical protein
MSAQRLSLVIEKDDSGKIRGRSYSRRDCGRCSVNHTIARVRVTKSFHGIPDYMMLCLEEKPYFLRAVAMND